MFQKARFENSRPDGFGVLEVQGISPSAEETPARQFVPLKHTELRGEIVGPLASLCLIQLFRYDSQACCLTLEAVYRFPLPGDAAVLGVTVRFGDETVEAELEPRRRAEETYMKAKREGQQAVLVSRESPDVFTLRVAGLQPDQDVSVETRYVQLARADGIGWSLRSPLTTTPRYVRADEQALAHAHGQPLAVLRDPGHRFRLDVLVAGASQISSPSHTLVLDREGTWLRVRLQDGEMLPDRDCLLRWESTCVRDLPALQVYLHEDKPTGQIYFLALVAPPASPALPTTSREVILLVDHSGSMSGVKWEASDWAVKRFLYDLQPDDAAVLGLFHDTTRWSDRQPQPASEKNIEGWITFLENHQDSGGTEMGIALEQALKLPRVAGKPSRHLLIVTDAEVSDAGRILRLADGEASQAERRRISVLCIDAAPNAFLAQELAARGGGLARFLTSSPDEEDITSALDQVLADWAAPLLANLRLEIDRPGVEAADATGTIVLPTGGSAIDLGDLPAGRTLWVAGRLPQGAWPTFSLAAHDQPALAQGEVQATLPAGWGQGLKALFGARRVLGLEFLLQGFFDEDALREQLVRLGYNPAQVLRPAGGATVYIENAVQDRLAALRDLLEREALSYGLASAETSFIGVRKVAGKRVEALQFVANALPNGMSGAFLSESVPMPFQFSPGDQGEAGALPPSPALASLSAMGAGIGISGIGLGPSMGASLRGMASPATPSTQLITLFAGTPAFSGGQAVLFDSTAPGSAALPEEITFSRLILRMEKPKQKLPAGLILLLYVGDPLLPAAGVRLADILRQGGKRPLNLLRRPGQIVRLVLEDPAGDWAADAPAIEISLEGR